ncbi:microcin C transport system substrate-binding protein [Sphaerotilus hippei]|uniref:Microcin C transport system substrate-binding protein n=1 Tax=Sphaerotilus hippei TaxID=744406 RepID=A0A318HEP5_9BURK|nr:extracellular solute-binding protein [Sphaerotilus hippei]PXW98213.1 microcin C transport system substrate-binding protein [Sphaerotilus hippei]
MSRRAEALLRASLRGGLLGLLMLLGPAGAWAAHAHAQFGDIRYPAGFRHFDYVNPEAPRGGAISLVAPVIASTFDKFNPFTLKGTEPPGLLSLVFDTLLVGTLDEPATAYGLLAEDVAVAPDGLSVLFRLNPKARFHDGEPVRAADVKHTFDQLTGPGASPQYSAYFGDVRAAVVLDERRIRFDFRRPNAELPLIVGSLPVFSRRWGQVDGQPRALDRIVTEHPIASGPYRIGRVDFGKEIRYERDPAYWARDLNVRRGQFNFDRITYQMYADNVAAFEGFKAGEFDFIQAFTAKDWARQYKGGRFDSGELIKRELQHGNATGFQGFIFNTRLPRLADARVRQAIGLAMDYEWMNRQLFYGAYGRLRGYFTQSEYEARGLPGPDELALLAPLRAQLAPAVFEQPVPMPPSTAPPGSLRDNLRQARALLAAAGWTYRDGALRDARGEPFTLEFLDNSESMGRVVLPVLRSLEKLGIRASFRVVDYAVFEKRMKAFDFELMTRRILGRLNPGAEQFQAFHSSLANTPGSTNAGGVADPAVDALITRLMAARTRAELVSAARALDRVLRHGHYAVPHWYSGVHRVAWRAGRFEQPARLPRFYEPEDWALSCWWSVAPVEGKR